MDTPKLLPSSIFGIINEIHIFSRLESSTSARMTGLTILISSQMGVLQWTVPDGRASTRVPDTGAAPAFSSTRARFCGGPLSLPTLLSSTASGTGMLSGCRQNTNKTEYFVECLIVCKCASVSLSWSSYLIHIVEISISEHLRSQQFVQLNDFLRKPCGDQCFSLADQLIFVLFHLTKRKIAVIFRWKHGCVWQYFALLSLSNCGETQMFIWLFCRNRNTHVRYHNPTFISNWIERLHCNMKLVLPDINGRRQYQMVQNAQMHLFICNRIESVCVICLQYQWATTHLRECVHWYTHIER